MTNITVSAHFDDAEIVELTNEHLIIYSPSEFRRSTIVNRYSAMIQDALKEIFDSDAKLIVLVRKSSMPSKTRAR